jgi:hypothetical protein
MQRERCSSSGDPLAEVYLLGAIESIWKVQLASLQKHLFRLGHHTASCNTLYGKDLNATWCPILLKLGSASQVKRNTASAKNAWCPLPPCI